MPAAGRAHLQEALEQAEALHFDELARVAFHMKLTLNRPHLMRQRTVDRERIEYKAGRNPDPILRTLCAFANDFANLGGATLC